MVFLEWVVYGIARVWEGPLCLVPAFPIPTPCPPCN